MDTTTNTDANVVLASLLSALIVGDSDGAKNPERAINAINGLLIFSSAEGELEGSEANKVIVNIAILILRGGGYNDNLVADGVWGEEGNKALQSLNEDLDDGFGKQVH